MKIWCQSGTSVGKDSRYNDYEETLKSYLNKVARPGTEVSVHGVEFCSSYIATSRYEALLHDHQIVENLFQAQREGYDAFCVICMMDPGFYALREVADIPVLFIAETSMLLACLLSPNFSLLSYNKLLTRKIIELVRRYGLQGRFIETDNLQIDQTEEAFHKGFVDPEIILRPAREVAKEAAKKGVCMFVSTDGRLNMIMAKYNINEIEGIPVLQGGGALIKMAEMIVDLKSMGIEKSKLGLYMPMLKEDLVCLRKVYGVG